MEVTQKLNVSAKYVYDRIVASVQYDITQSTGQTVPVSDLVGFKYKKSFSNNQFVNIEIAALEHEKKYQFFTNTPRNTFNTLYEIEAVDDKSCRVRYFETMTSSGMIQKLNDMAVGFILGRIKKKRIKMLLNEIENSATAETE